MVRALASHQCGRGSNPGVDMWVEFVVGSLPCSERFFSGYSGFPLSPKTNTSKFQFDLERTDTEKRALKLLGASWVNKLHLSFIATPDSCGYLAIISWYLGLSRKSNSPLSTLVNSTGIENFLLTSVMSIIARFTYLVDVPSKMSIFRTSFFHLPLDTRSRSAANT